MMDQLIVLILLLVFSITNLVLVEKVKMDIHSTKVDNNQNQNQETFLIIGEAISGFCLAFLVISLPFIRFS